MIYIHRHTLHAFPFLHIWFFSSSFIFVSDAIYSVDLFTINDHCQHLCHGLGHGHHHSLSSYLQIGRHAHRRGSKFLPLILQHSYQFMFHKTDFMLNWNDLYWISVFSNTSENCTTCIILLTKPEYWLIFDTNTNNYMFWLTVNVSQSL